MIWVGGDTATTCRDIIQNKLLGDVGDFGSGMIPKDCIIETKPRRNLPDGIESVILSECEYFNKSLDNLPVTLTYLVICEPFIF